MSPTKTSRALTAAARDLSAEVDRLRFGAPVTHVYNPLAYARAAHETYIGRYAIGPRRVVFLGMNPGPFGMAQNGVPFGDTGMVRGWLQITARVGRPQPEHPKRPVHGFDCPRGEVSGQRFWGAAQEHFDTPDRFFSHHYVANYCPLCFMEESGRNRTPDKLPKAEREPLYDACDRHLVRVVNLLAPEWVIGVGRFARDRAEQALKQTQVRVGQILHPSPASPLANKGWAEAVQRELVQLGICGD